ncbi:uncharacterized protein LOC143285290 [Babylonia areolata]|uniref:uncharacterized protein LOC143285290 n=1 Tax=Babylonia areolata TaxID=304850 RepID=UPI003FD3052D
MSGKGATFEELRDLLLMEQLLAGVSPELATFIRERQPKNVQEAADLAEAYTEARRCGKGSKQGGVPHNQLSSSGRSPGQPVQEVKELGRPKAILMSNPVFDLLIGNKAVLKDGVELEIPVYKAKEEGVAVVTRAQAKRDSKPFKALKPTTGEVGEVTPEDLRVAQTEDTSLDKFRELAEGKNVRRSGKSGKVQFLEKKGILYRQYSGKEGTYKQVVVPAKYRQELLRLAHESLMGGHLGSKKTLERIWQQFFWPGLCTEVRRFCMSCDLCQKATPKGRTKKVPLVRMPLIDTPFRRVGIDLVGPILPASESGNRYILTVVDYATRYPEAVPLKGIEAERVAEALFEIWSRVGIPSEVLTDRGTQFTSEVMRQVNCLLSIRGLTTTPYHAQCNGLVERFNGTLKSMLKKLCQEQPRQWDRFLPALLFAYREAPQESLGFSPFELLYGCTVRGPLAVLRQAWTDEEATEEVKTTAQYVVNLRNRLEETCALARDNLGKSSSRYARYFDHKAKPRTFKPGDQVLLLLSAKHNKLQVSWQGPYTVVERVGKADYRIEVEGQLRLYHANLLKQYLERAGESKPVSAVHVAVVMDEEVSQKSTQKLPLCPLEAEESTGDVCYGPTLTAAQRSQAAQVIEKRARVVTDLPLKTDLGECELLLREATPVRVKQYPLPHAKQAVVRKEVQDMVKLGVIEPACSPYNSPIVLVAKKDGKVRFCVDYRKLNGVTEFDAEPLPDPEFLFCRLSKSRYLSKIDLSKGYWQVPVKVEDRPKTAFSTPLGQFQWTVMPFGLQNAVAVFSRVMRRLLEPLGHDDVQNFMDDVIVATDTWEQHVQALEALFGRLDEANLSVRPSKCFIGFEELKFLGHVVGQGRMRPTEDKVAKIRDASRPATKKEVRSFLGLSGYYRRFMPNFSTLAAPLSDLTKKGKPNQVQWTESCEKAFRTLKERLCCEPVVRLADPEAPFILRTDASNEGLGAVLLQEGDGLWQPVHYASRKLTSAERNYATVEQECLAVVWAVDKFEPYLYGRHFVLQTDHQPLAFLHKAKHSNSRLMSQRNSLPRRPKVALTQSALQPQSRQVIRSDRISSTAKQSHRSATTGASPM